MPTVEDVVKAYLKLRGEKTRIEHEAKQEVAAIKEKMAKMENWLLDQSNKTGVASFKTDAGTAYRVEKKSARVADWEALLGYIQTNERWQLLKRDVNKTAVEEELSESGNVPPGVNYESRFEINVRSASSK